MIQSCRDVIRDALFQPIGDLERINPPKGHHAGLLLSRYLAGHWEEYDVPSLKGKPKRALLERAVEACNASRPIARHTVERWNTYLNSICDVVPFLDGYFKTVGRLVIGLGTENVLETGLTLHHTYGIPVLPGSALKGLAAHYCSEIWGVQDEEFRKDITLEDGSKRVGQYFHEIFGTTEDAGHVTFYDAMWSPARNDEGLFLDVMTPHHMEYYGGEATAPPADFDDPNPVSFLSFSGTLYVSISVDAPGEQGGAWVDLAFEILKQSLETWGAGGKTNAGYGVLLQEEEG